MIFLSKFHFRPCDHRGVNLGGYYRCLCEEGFELEKDERSCKRVKSKCDLKESEMNFFPICFVFSWGHDGEMAFTPLDRVG